MEKTIHPIFVEKQAFGYLNEFLSAYNNYRFFVLVDDNTAKFCLPKLNSILKRYNAEIIEIPSGEMHKTLQTCQIVWNTLLSKQATRKTLFINLGGGVVSDLGGFAASVYKRGIPFIHIPTTLLAAVDAAIGGKTGVDYRALKNQLGVFAYPEAIFIFPGFFETLDSRQIKTGFAEMLKHGLIADKNYWNDLSKLSDFDKMDWNKLIQTSIDIKSKIVEQDPDEQGIRKLLNFGHTFGHAFESFSVENHNIPLTHGEAVALGIMAELKLSIKKTGFDSNEAQHIKSYLSQHFPIYKFFNENIAELLRFMVQDKKNTSEGINFTLLRSVGEGVYDQICSMDEVKECLIDFIAEQ